MSRLNGIKAVCIKDVKRIMREKSFIFIIAAQLLILSLSISFGRFFPDFLSGGYRIPPGFALVGVVGPDEFWKAFNNTSLFERTSLESGLLFFRRGNYNALVVARSFLVNSSNPVVVDYYLNPGAKSALITSRVKGALQRIDDEVRQVRLKDAKINYTEFRLNTISDKNVGLDLLYTLLLPLFMLSISVVAGNLMITLVATESEEKTLPLLASTPMTVMDILLSKSLTCMVVMPTQLFVWILVLMISNFGIAHPCALFALGLVYTLFFIALGLFSYSMTLSRDAAQNVYAVLILPVFAFLLPVYGGLSESKILLGLVPPHILSYLSLSNTVPDYILAGIAVTILVTALVYLLSLKNAVARMEDL